MNTLKFTLVLLLAASCSTPIDLIDQVQRMIDLNDADGDGFSPPDDCDDENSSMHPGADDPPGDDIDQDCDGRDSETGDTGDSDTDTDTDTGCVDTAVPCPYGTGDTGLPTGSTGHTGIGHTAHTGQVIETGHTAETGIVIETAHTGDTGQVVTTGDTGSTAETGDTGIDPNDVDDDGDGFTENGGDCDDIVATIYPGRLEVCDGLDNNCVGGIDDGTACQDQLCVTVDPSVTGNVDVYLFETQMDPLGSPGENRTYWVDQVATNPVVGTPFMSGDAAGLICGDMTRVPYASGHRVLLLPISTDGIELPLVTGDAGIGYTSLVSAVTLDGSPVVDFSNSESACDAPYDCTDCIMP